MFETILSGLIILFFAWMAISSAIAAARLQERGLFVMALAALLLALSQVIPLLNLLSGGFGSGIGNWVQIQTGLYVLAVVCLIVFSVRMGGMAHIQARGVSMKDILLLRVNG